MRRLARRSISLMLVVVLFLTGFGIFSVRYIQDGAQWAAFRPNLHAYSYGVLVKGAVVDRDGYPLSWVQGGTRTYSAVPSIRSATLHVVGDAQGNIGTGLLNTYESQLMGYNLLGGLHSADGMGNTLRTTLDASLCLTALQSLGNRKGAVVVYNYTSGDILCMVSSPTFDPLYPPDTDEVESNPSYEGVYLNRTISSTFTPGSIFKLITLQAAIECLPSLWDMEFTCEGSINIAGDIITCNDVHGTLDIHDALACSCNVVFSQLALMLGGETLYDYAKKAGLLNTFQCSRSPVKAGSFEIAPDESADLAWSGIGQFNDLVSPLAAARFAGAIANHGISVAPRIVDQITNGSGIPVRLVPKSARQRLLDDDTADIMQQMMLYNVASWYGAWRFPGLHIGAKSGTAEVVEGDQPHAWFIGFLDDPAHPLAFAVFVENGGWGLDVAGQIANTVLQEAVQLKM